MSEFEKRFGIKSDHCVWCCCENCKERQGQKEGWLEALKWADEHSRTRITREIEELEKCD